MAPRARRAGLLLVTSLVMTPAIATSPAFAAEGDTVTFFNINDFHGRISASGEDLACTLEIQRQAAGETGTSFFFSAGDNIGASEFDSFIDQDNPTIDYLNVMELDASAVGNHEFDQGYDDLTGRVDDRATWEYLGANVYGTDGQRALPAYTIEERDGVRVAVIGVVTEQTPTLVSPSGVEGLDFRDPVDEVNLVVQELENSGESYDIIVAEYHDGSSQSGAKGEVVGGELMDRIANDTDARVDAIFTGHTHQTYNFTSGDRPILQTGDYGQNLASVTFTEQADGSYLATASDLISTKGQSAAPECETFPRFVEARTIISAAEQRAEELGAVQVGTVTEDITTAWAPNKAEYVDGVWTRKDGVTDAKGDDRSSSSAISNEAAESQVWALSQDTYAGEAPDFGIMGPGSMRAEMYYGEDGEITFREANDVMPFANNVHTVDLTAAQVYELFEQQWQPDGASRSYLQLGFSDNVSYTYDSTAPRGERILEIYIDGELVDPASDEVYTVVGQSFLLDGGDNFTVLTEGTNRIDTGLLDRDTWVSYLKAQSPLDADFSQRGVNIQNMNPEAAGTTEDPLVLRVTKLHSTSLGAPQITTAVIEVAGHTYEAEYLWDEEAGEWAAVFELAAPQDLEEGTYTGTLTANPETGTSIPMPFTIYVPGTEEPGTGEPTTEEPTTEEPTTEEPTTEEPMTDEPTTGASSTPAGNGTSNGSGNSADNAGSSNAGSSNSGSSMGSLPRTGAEIAPYALGALLLTAAGGVLLALRKRASK